MKNKNTNKRKQESTQKGLDLANKIENNAQIVFKVKSFT